MTNERTSLLLQLVIIAAAVALFFAPWALNFADVEHAAWNAWALAAGMLIAGAAASADGVDWGGWTLLAVGLWALLSPVLLGFGTHAGAFWSHIVAGLVALGASWASLRPWNGGGLHAG